MLVRCNRLIKKAIIPAAGYGTRSLPITKVVPKEMFPIGVKPAIHYVVEEAAASGVEEILIIVSRTKNLIVDYFDYSLELEAYLERQNKQHLMQSTIVPNVQIFYTRQPFANGLGDAIRLGKSFVGNDPFAVLLPDDLMVGEEKPGLEELIDAYEKNMNHVIGVKKVESEFLKNYGVIKGNEIEKGLYQLEDIIEKPKENPPSNLAVIGRYVFNPSIFSSLDKVTKGVGGEIQLTDAIKEELLKNSVQGKIIEAMRYDIGSTKDYIELINKVNKSSMDKDQ
jgi:UTP--glucose-1-phosphate uridylyltransferase